MNEVTLNKIEYPVGVEYRTPRPRGALGDAAVGGLLGLLLTRNAMETEVVKTLSNLLANQPQRLPDAVRQKFQEKGYPILQFYRNGRFVAKVTFKYNDIFVILKSQAPREPEMTVEQLSDWLYGDLTEQQFDNILNKLHAKYGTQKVS